MPDPRDVSNGVRFARRIFQGAAIWGVAVLLPLYFAEQIFAWAGLPAVTHPEYLYGFVGGALVAQFFYWLIGNDPIRYRAFMLPAVLAKLVYFVPITILFAMSRADGQTLFFACVDFMLGVLFLIAWRRTEPLHE